MSRDSRLTLCAGSASTELSKSIAKRLKLRLLDTTVGAFSDGESKVEINSLVRGKDVFLIQSVYAPQNDNLMEIMLTADALRRSDIHKLTLVAPYLAYSRQDRRPKRERSPITSRVVANMLQSAGIKRIITADIHAAQIQGFYQMPFINLEASTLFVADIWSKFEENSVVVSPDAGGTERARYIAKQVGADLAVIDKRRPSANEAEVMNILGDVEGKTCLIVDDMVDTAGTLCKGAQALIERGGASEVYAYCTHPVLSGQAIHRINDSVIKELVVTDSIPLNGLAKHNGKFRVLSLSQMLAEAIRRTQMGESVSLMYS